MENNEHKTAKLNMSSEELVALASTLAISIARNFELQDLFILRSFFSTLASNLSLIESQRKGEIKKK